MCLVQNQVGMADGAPGIVFVVVVPLRRPLSNSTCQRHRAIESRANHECEWGDGERLVTGVLTATSARDITFS